MGSNPTLSARDVPGLRARHVFLFGHFLPGNSAFMAVVVGGEQETLFGFDDDGMNRVVSERAISSRITMRIWTCDRSKMLRNDDKPVRLSSCGVGVPFLVGQTKVQAITAGDKNRGQMSLLIFGASLFRGSLNHTRLTLMLLLDQADLTVSFTVKQPKIFAPVGRCHVLTLLQVGCC